MDYLKEIYELLKQDTTQLWTLAATLTSTILWGIYVYFTIKTFNQIKKQTDLQSRAFLLVTPKTQSIHNDIDIIDSAKELQEKWNRILENNLPEAITENRIFEFELTNRGKSDIISWNININLKINEGDYLKNEFGINGENSNLSINSKSDQTIAPNQTLIVPVILVGDFPKIGFNWNISYVDLMEGEYDTSSKNNGFTINNLIALNYKK